MVGRDAGVHLLDAGDGALVTCEDGRSRGRLGASEEVRGLARELLLRLLRHVDGGVLLGLERRQPDLRESGKRRADDGDRRNLARLQELRDRRLVVRQHLEVDEAVDALVQEGLDVADGDRPVEVVDGLHDLRAADALGGVDEPVRQADGKGLSVGEDVVADLVARLLAERLRRVRQILLRRRPRVRSAGSRRRDGTARRQRHGEHGQHRDRHHSEPQSLSSVFRHVGSPLIFRFWTTQSLM